MFRRKAKRPRQLSAREMRRMRDLQLLIDLGQIKGNRKEREAMLELAALKARYEDARANARANGGASRDPITPTGARDAAREARVDRRMKAREAKQNAREARRARKGRRG